MTGEQRAEAIAERLRYGKPIHSIPHFQSDCSTYFLISAACFSHLPIIGHSTERMRIFERDLVHLLRDNSQQVFAWNVLPNHYHALVDTYDILVLLKRIGQLHGRNSFFWNGEDQQRSRQVWCNAAETVMKSERHFYASLNYVLHNAAYHGYVHKWTDWPYCNASEYLESVGRERAMSIWKTYPLYDYGKEWDPPEK